MIRQKETATVKRPGGFDKGRVASQPYKAEFLSATEIASAIVARRFRLSLPVARLVCELAAIGGRVR